MRFRAQGYLGGLQGARAAFRTSDGRPRNPKLTQRLAPETRFVLELPGGGGYHDPQQRSADELREDIADGLVSRTAAVRDYGSLPAATTTENGTRRRTAQTPGARSPMRKEPA
jgi:N-methylhydantoinase B